VTARHLADIEADVDQARRRSTAQVPGAFDADALDAVVSQPLRQPLVTFRIVAERLCRFLPAGVVDNGDGERALVTVDPACT
jgi:hypothetical protein